MRTLEVLSTEKFQEIFTNEELRNAVAFAHECLTASPGSRFSHLKALAYPVEYIVTSEQKEKALQEMTRAKNEIFQKHENDLLFCSMGCSFAPRFDDDFCNHRARTEFLNAEGKRYFIEVGTDLKDGLRVDFSIDRDLEIQYDNKCTELREKINTARDNRDYQLEKDLRAEKEIYMQQVYYHFGGITNKDLNLKFTKTNVLELVNKTFGCNFKNIIVDQNTIHPNDREIICKSPKF